MVLTPPAKTPAKLTGAGDRWSVQFRAMGTNCRVDFGAPSRGRAADFSRQAVEWVQEFEAKYTRFRDDSMVAEINRAAGVGWVEIDADLERMLALCGWFHWRTQGVFDPTMLPLARLWDYHTPERDLPSDAAIAEARSRVGWSKVMRRAGAVFLSQRGMELDLGGIGKEFAVDQVCGLAQRAGVRDYLVDFGGDVRAAGSPPEGGPWRIGLEDPREPERCWGGVTLNDRAVATSGNYRRYFERGGQRFGHILDPRQGRPAVGGGDAASVVAQTCVEAGIFSTVAIILPPAEALSMLTQTAHTAGAIWAGKVRHETLNFHRYAI